MSSLLTDVVAWYELDDANDSHTNGYDLTTENGTVAYVAGKIGNAIDVSGASDFISLAVAMGHDLVMGDNSFSVDLWVYFNTGAIGVSQEILGLDNSDWKITKASNDHVRFHVNGSLIAEVATAVSAETWYNVRADWNKTAEEQVLEVVGLGSVDTEDRTGQTPDDAATTFFIGQVDGLVDNVIIRKGSIFSSGERAILNNSGNGLSYASATAIAGRSKLGLGLKVGLR